MTAAIASAFVFVAIVAACQAVLTSRGGSSAERRLRDLRAITNERIADAPRKARSSFPRLSRWLAGRAWAEHAASQLKRANVQLKAGEYLLLRSALGAILFVAPLILFGAPAIVIAVSFVLGVIGYNIPSFWLNWMIDRRLQRFERQLIDGVPAIASSLRAGFALQRAIEIAGEQVGPPLSEELAQLLHDLSLGSGMEAALLDLGRRIDSTDLDMIITAILVQRTTGGNLAEVLDQAAETMNERERIRGDIMTLTAQQRLTGTILSVYPALVGLLFLAIMPGLWSDLFTRTVGQMLLGIACSLQLLGFVLIRRTLRVQI